MTLLTTLFKILGFRRGSGECLLGEVLFVSSPRMTLQTTLKFLDFAGVLGVRAGTVLS